MIRSEYHRRDVESLGGSGLGTACMEYWLEGEELPPNLRMISTVTLPPGASVGIHPHGGEAEIYRVLSGTGMYHDNGTETEIGPGFVTACYDGGTHGLINTGSSPLVFDAVIVQR